MIVDKHILEDALDYAIIQGEKAYRDTEGNLTAALEETCKEFLSTLPDKPNISLRDKIATAALQGMLASPAMPQASETKDGETYAQYYSRNAYQFADAMLKEREKQ